MTKRIDAAILERILLAGTKAISPYNSQPWRIRLRDDGFEIFLLRHKNFFFKLLGVYQITLGAMLENMRVAAGHEGYDLEATTHNAIGPDAPAATVVLAPAEPIVGSCEYLFSRHSNRTGYERTHLDEQTKASLKKLVQTDAIELQILEDRLKDYAASTLAALEGVRFSNSWLVEELLNNIRWDQDDNEKHRDLLDIETLEVSRGSRLAMKAIHVFRPIYWVLRIFGFCGMVVRKQRKTIHQAGALIVFTMRRWSPDDMVHLGGLIQQTMNELNRADYDSVPLVSGLYLMDLLRENREIFTNAQALRILLGRNELEDILRIHDGRRVAFVLRVGRKISAPVQSLRKPLADVMVK